MCVSILALHLVYLDSYLTHIHKVESRSFNFLVRHSRNHVLHFLKVRGVFNDWGLGFLQIILLRQYLQTQFWNYFSWLTLIMECLPQKSKTKQKTKQKQKQKEKQKHNKTKQNKNKIKQNKNKNKQTKQKQNKNKIKNKYNTKQPTNQNKTKQKQKGKGKGIFRDSVTSSSCIHLTRSCAVLIFCFSAWHRECVAAILLKGTSGLCVHFKKKCRWPRDSGYH